MKHEWDWPEGDPARRTVTFVPRRRGWTHPMVTRFCDLFFRAVAQGVAVVIALVVSLIGIGAIWLAFAAIHA